MVAGNLRVRFTNHSGHKLPTGYGEGRRMWIEVRFLGPGRLLGGYRQATADLETQSTQVYELVQGLNNYMAGLTGLAAGPSFHFVLNNTILLDNRIPPRGYSRSAFASRGAEPVGYDCWEQQYWDDTYFPIQTVPQRLKFGCYTKRHPVYSSNSYATKTQTTLQEVKPSTLGSALARASPSRWASYA